jgi:hypothetical protein
LKKQISFGQLKKKEKKMENSTTLLLLQPKEKEKENEKENEKEKEEEDFGENNPGLFTTLLEQEPIIVWCTLFIFILLFLALGPLYFTIFIFVSLYIFLKFIL